MHSGVWKVIEDEETPNQKPLAQLGPARRVAEQPFLIVIGMQFVKTLQSYVIRCNKDGQNFMHVFVEASSILWYFTESQNRVTE